MAEGAVRVDVPIVDSGGGFNPELGWTQRSSQKLGLHLVEYDIEPLRETLVSDEGREFFTMPDIRFELQFRVTAEPRPIQRPIQRDWFRRFCPGGLPSSGKRA